MTTNHPSTTAEAARFLQTLRIGDSVVVTQDGRDYTMTVSRSYQRADGAYGDPNGGNVVATLGPGRWSTTVSAGRVADGYVAIRRADTDELMVEPTEAEAEACDVCNELPCEECGADAGQPCAWSCTARPEAVVHDAPLNVRATIRRPDGDTCVVFAGQVPAWLWEDTRTRELWKRENRGAALLNAHLDPKARGYRVSFDAWDPAEAPIV